MYSMWGIVYTKTHGGSSRTTDKQPNREGRCASTGTFMHGIGDTNKSWLKKGEARYAWREVKEERWCDGIDIEVTG